jgi:hypothetical protein
MTIPAPVSIYSLTGIPSLNGDGFAYEPGSSMTLFMDSVNNLAGSATRLPNGQSVVDWANGLVQQQQLRRLSTGLLQPAPLGTTGVNPLQAAPLGTTGVNPLQQVLQTLQVILAGFGQPVI